MSIHSYLKNNRKVMLGFISSLIICGLFQTNAFGFGGGMVVATGTNPAFSVGGGVSSASTILLQTAPMNGTLMVSDVILTADPRTDCSNTVSLRTSGGAFLGQFRLGAQRQNNGGGYSTYAASPSQIQHSFAFGLPVPAGEDLELLTSTNCAISYTIAGYIGA